MKNKLDKFFKFTERGSSLKTEIVAGLTTFFTMAYIVMVNPNSVAGDALINLEGQMRTIWLAVYTASILVAVIGTLIVAFYSNRPFAQACGMGLNAFFFVSFILPELLSDGDPIKGYKEGLCIILISGVIFLILSLTGVRKYIARALPDCLKKAIPAGIGLFIAFLGFQNVGLIQKNAFTIVQLFDFHGMFSSVGLTLAEIEATQSEGVFVAFNEYFSGDLTATVTSMDAWRLIAPVIITLLGLFLIALLEYKKIKGSAFISIGASTVLYYLATWQVPSFSLENIGDSFVAFGEVGFLGAFEGFGVFSGGIMAVLNAVVLIITFCLVDMFDTVGTLYGAASQADMLDENGDPLDMDKLMTADSVGTAVGAALGTSTCTTFVESTAGIAAGARTGLASVVTAACFFVCLFLSPVAAIVPACATAPALIYVGVLMLKNFAKVDLSDITSAVPAFMALVMMPLTYSISNGIAMGAIAYTVITLITGKYSKKDIVVTLIAILFAVRFLAISM